MQKKKFFLFKGNPSAYETIAKETGKSYESIRNILSKLKRKDKVRSVVMELSRASHKRTFHSEQLIDGLTRKPIAYLLGDERLLGEKIIEYLPEELTRGMRHSLSLKLKRFLPKESLEVVREYMSEHETTQ